jgi:hypothetical protein
MSTITQVAQAPKESAEAIKSGSLIQQMLEAMDTAHAKNVIHHNRKHHIAVS